MPFIVDTSSPPPPITGVPLSDLLTEFYAHGFDYLDDNAAGTTRAKRWINQAIGEINDMENWPYLETATTGTSPLTITDLKTVESVLTPTGPLEMIDRRALSAQVDDAALTGTATYFYLSSVTTINTYPASTEQLAVNYWRVETPLVNDADTTAIPERFMDTIIWGAVRKGLKDDADSADAKEAMDEWSLGIDQMRRALLPVFEYQLLTDSSVDN